MSAAIPTEQSSDQGKGQKLVPGAFQILNVAFLNILTWDYISNPLPEVSRLHSSSVFVNVVISRTRFQSFFLGSAVDLDER